MSVSNELIAALNTNNLVTVSVYIEYSKLIALGNRRLGYEFVVTYTDNSKQYIHAWKSVSEADLGKSYKGRFSLTHMLQASKTIQSINSTGLHIQCNAIGVKLGLPKIEIGNKATDWSPAPEDIENKVANIQTDLQIAINNARALIAVETQNRQRTDTNVSKLVNKTNFLSDTYTEGNAIATGTMILGNSLGVQAGITGVGAANNDIRFWAGSNYTDRKRAPFMVTQDGTLYATKANISGEINATSGSFTGVVNATSGSFTGQINASSGKIGGIDIHENGLGASENTNDWKNYKAVSINKEGRIMVIKNQYTEGAHGVISGDNNYIKMNPNELIIYSANYNKGVPTVNAIIIKPDGIYKTNDRFLRTMTRIL